MKTSTEMRLENARALKGAGTTADFARLLEMEPQQANQIIGPNPKRGIGDDIARRIEKAFEMEVGWLDHDHTCELNTSIRSQNPALSDEAKSLILCVERLDSVGEMAKATFRLHTGLLQVSAAFTEFQTGAARSHMLAEVDKTLGPRVDPLTGPPHARTLKK